MGENDTKIPLFSNVLAESLTVLQLDHVGSMDRKVLLAEGISKSLMLSVLSKWRPEGGKSLSRCLLSAGTEQPACREAGW